MTPDEYTSALSRTRINVHGKPAAAARLVLVDGLTGTAAHKQTQCAQSSISRVLKLLRKAASNPDLPVLSAPSMTLEQFHAAVRLTKMPPGGKTVEAAKLVLVDGMTQKAATAAVSGNAPAISRGCTRVIKAAHMSYCPHCGTQLR